MYVGFIFMAIKLIYVLHTQITLISKRWVLLTEVRVQLHDFYFERCRVAVQRLPYTPTLNKQSMLLDALATIMIMRADIINQKQVVESLSSNGELRHELHDFYLGSLHLDKHSDSFRNTDIMIGQGPGIYLRRIIMHGSSSQNRC